MLEELKLMLGITENDRDALLKLIISSVTARLRTLLGGAEPPESLEYIIREVSIIRYNKIGSEGMQSHAVEGESHNFVDNDFGAYMDDIQAYRESQKESVKGKVRFL